MGNASSEHVRHRLRRSAAESLLDRLFYNFIPPGPTAIASVRPPNQPMETHDSLEVL
jgi:hypothetical protein